MARGINASAGYAGVPLAAADRIQSVRKDIEFSVVSGSSEEMLFSCLESVHGEMRSNAGRRWSVTVTCSTDAESLVATRVRQRYPHAAIVETHLPRNPSSSHRSVLRQSEARYVWLIDDDIILMPGAVGRVLAFMERPENSRVAMVGPRLLNPDGMPTRSGYAFPSMRGILLEQSGLSGAPVAFLRERFRPVRAPGAAISTRQSVTPQTREVDTLPCACIVLKSTAVKQAGVMLDASSKRGAEAEWHRRFQENGWKVMAFADASVMDYGGLSLQSDVRSQSPDRLEGALYFFRTGRQAAFFRLFCASLLGVVGARATFGWLLRNRASVSAARIHAGIAWRELTSN